MTERPDIEDVKRVQARLGWLATHVAYLDGAGFVIAHTDDERRNLDDLADCDLHRWLLARDEAPSTYDGPGYYEAAPAEPEDKSESSGFERWEFFPLDPAYSDHPNQAKRSGANNDSDHPTQPKRKRRPSVKSDSEPDSRLGEGG